MALKPGEGLGKPWEQNTKRVEPKQADWQVPHFDEHGNAVASDIVDDVNTPEVQAETDAAAAQRLRQQLKNKLK